MRQRDIEIDMDSMPSLPKGLSAMAGVQVGDHVYVAGGHDGQAETKVFWRLNLSDKDSHDSFKWEALDPWPGPPRSHLIAAAQSDGKNDCLYLFSGRFHDPVNGWVMLKDSYRYDPTVCTWTRLADVGTNLSVKDPVCVMAGAGIRLGAMIGCEPKDLQGLTIHTLKPCQHT
jgi:N-acetylneuraminic acid mutarotase